ncbi:MAG: HNH nuclease family protein [Desulfobacterales bacterium]|nr:YajD family HNH nuclease [Deltaproteobacteria bacterium]NNL43742.1 HNH nuclease family protein [Desulfobacterales bacterium]
MSSKKVEAGVNRINQVVAAVRRDRERLEKSYRERALKMFPWICARCGREFTGKRLRELTVHHKDHNHDHNPPDGSNWELLCIYCHDNEHSRYLDEQWNMEPNENEQESPSIHRPFADLETLLKKKK